MKMKLLRNLPLTCCMALLVLFFSSCASDSDSTETSEAVSSDNGENNQAGQANDEENGKNNAEGETDELVSQNKENGTENAAPKEGEGLEKSTDEMIGNIAKNEKNAAPTEVAATNSVPVTNSAPAPVEPPAAASTPVPAPAASAEGSQRVVRFITANETPIYDKPNGAVVTKLAKGDHAVVLEQGEWSQITENRFVMTSALSKNIIPTEVNISNTWQVEKPGT